MTMTEAIRRALFRLRDRLEDPDSPVGFTNDPAVSTGPCGWIQLTPTRDLYISYERHGLDRILKVHLARFPAE